MVRFKVEDDEMPETDLKIGDTVEVVRKGRWKNQKGAIHCSGTYFGVVLDSGVHIRAKPDELKIIK